MVDLSIIIVSYNTKNLLKDCLESLTRAARFPEKTAVPAPKGKQGSSRPGWTWTGQRLETDAERQLKLLASKPLTEVIIVDNGSTDGTVKMVRSQFPWVGLIANQQNFGFAKANNIGLKQSSGRYRLLLNPDTIVFPRTLEVMCRYMDKYPRVAVSTCRVELPDGRLDLPSHRGFPTPWRSFCHFAGLGKLVPRSRLFNGYYLGHLNLETIHEIDSPMGAFYLVRQEAIKEVGLLDEDYFWYGEDLDWSFRFKQAGWKISYVPHVKILHYHGAASGVKKSSRAVTTADRQTRRMVARESIRAMRLFYQKHYLDRYPKIVTKLIFLVLGLLEEYRVRRWGSR